MARAIDADALQELCNRRIRDTWNSGTAPVSWAEAYADFKDDIDSIPTLTPPNEPLTLEELREMEGEPVWVEFEDGSGGLWGIVHITIFAQIVFANGLHCTIGERYYGKSYKAYRRPPEGET